MGRLVADKGPGDLLDAVIELRSSHPRLKLLLVGSGRGQAGDIEEALRRRIQDQRLEGSVTLAGYQSDEALYYTIFDVCVLSSVAQVLGMTLVHAMMAGKPVIGTTVGGPSEVIEHGRTGLLVPPRSPHALAMALRSLIDDPAHARALSSAGREHALAQYRVEQMTARMEDVYASIAVGEP